MKVENVLLSLLYHPSAALAYRRLGPGAPGGSLHNPGDAGKILERLAEAFIGLMQ